MPCPTFEPFTLLRLITTPGCSKASCEKSRPLSGIAPSCCSVTTWEMVPVVVSTSGAAPSTRIDSDTLPSVIWVLTSASWPTVSARPDRTDVWKPESWALTS